MKSLSQFNEILLGTFPVDFRKGIRSLAALVESEYGARVFSGTLFLFTNKHKDSIKILYWDKTGFALWQKILDREKFKWPKNVACRTLPITTHELEWLLEGIDLAKIKRHKYLEYSRLC